MKPIFSDAEMRRRADLLLEKLHAARLDAAVFHTSDSVFYVSGVPLLSAWGRPMWAAMDSAGNGAVFGPWLEKEHMERTWFNDLRYYADEENVWDASVRQVADFVRERGVADGRIGVELSLLPMGLFESLRAALPDAEFVEIGTDLAAIRLIKSEEELQILRTGATIAKIGAAAFLEALHDNVTELEVAAHAVREMDRALAALYPEAATSTYAYCQTAEHTLTPHLHPTGRRIRRGDIIALNVFPTIWGYCMELERTFVFGEPTPQQQAVLDAVNEAFEAGKEAVKPGVRMGDVDKLTRKILTDRGFGDFIRHGTGHAHGIMLGAAGREELGEVRVYNSQRFGPNMICSIEPGVYIPNLGGFRHSDVLIVTEEGSECVTDFARDIVYTG